MKKLGLTVLLLSITGCASISYKPVMLDSSEPSELVNLRPCSTKGDTNKCKALVQADKWVSPTGIAVHVGDTYCIDVPPDQWWFDADRRNAPPHGEKGNWIMRLSQKRNADAGFFALIVNVQSEDGTVEEKAGQLVSSPRAYRYTSKSAGKLVLYPNDAKGPPSNPAHWYKNNSGQIWVTVARCP